MPHLQQSSDVLIARFVRNLQNRDISWKNDKGIMKRSLLWICLITFILLASTQELSAKDWKYQKSGTTSNLTAVSFVDMGHTKPGSRGG